MTGRSRGIRVRWRAVHARVAVVARGDRATDCAALLRAYAGVSGRIEFLSPADTARTLAGIPVNVRSVPDSAGFDVRLGTAMAGGRVDAVILVGSNSSSQQELATMIRACDLQGIPLATNLVTAEILIRHIVANAGHPGVVRRRRGDDPVRPALRLVSGPERKLS